MSAIFVITRMRGLPGFLIMIRRPISNWKARTQSLPARIVIQQSSMSSNSHRRVGHVIAMMMCIRAHSAPDVSVATDRIRSNN